MTGSHRREEAVTQLVNAMQGRRHAAGKGIALCSYAESTAASSVYRRGARSALADFARCGFPQSLSRDRGSFAQYEKRMVCVL